MYCTQADLEKAMSRQTLIALSNDDARATDPCPDIVAEAITTACEEIDGYLMSRYRLPMDKVPTVVKKLAIDLARYSLYARRPEGYEFPAAVQSLRNQAIDLLKQIQCGKFALASAEGIDAGQAVCEPGEIQVANRTRLFGRSFWETF